MKIRLLIIGIITSFALQAQETAASAGEDLSANQHIVNFTIGEAIIGDFYNGKYVILNGYHQPYINISTIDIKDTENWKVNVFPNPSQNIINIVWDYSKNNNLFYQLFSIDGKLIVEGNNNQQISINVSEIAVGNYILSLTNNDKKQTYKIQKNK